MCDVILPALLIMCQFLFCGQESKQRTFYRVEKSVFSMFSLVKFINPCSSIISSTLDLIIFCESFFNHCLCHAFLWLFMKIVHGICGYIKAPWDNHQNCLFYHVLLVPVCRLVPPIVSGQRRPESLQTNDKCILQEDKW